jgi:hypothetical protein
MIALESALQEIAELRGRLPEFEKEQPTYLPEQERTWHSLQAALTNGVVKR